MATTWEYMVGLRETPACVYCGSIPENAACTKTMAANDLCRKPWCDDAIGRCFKNILAQAIQQHRWETSEEPDGGGECIVFACTNCFNCMTRRIQRGVFVLPVQELRWRIQTLEKITQKSMDSRVLLRVASALVAKHEGGTSNYYLSPSIFTAAEQSLVAEIANCAQMSDIDSMLASHIVCQNGDTPFMTNNKTVEFIRQHYKEPRG